jgi:hypothetical protein
MSNVVHIRNILLEFVESLQAYYTAMAQAVGGIEEA